MDDKDNHIAGLVVSDSQPNHGGYRRIWVGRTAADAATLALMDAAGNKRIMLKVAANGGAKMEFLDRDGNVVKVIGGRPSTRKRVNSHFERPLCGVHLR